MPVYPRESKRKGTVYDVVVHTGGKTVWRRGFRTPAEAGREEIKLRAAIIKGEMIPNAKLTLADFIEKDYLPDVERRVKKHTYNVYKSTMHHAIEILGRKKLVELTHRDISLFVRTLPARGLNPTSVALALARLRTALEEAVHGELINRNPAKQVKGPRKLKHEPPEMSIEAIENLFAVAEGAGYGALVYLAVTTGLRWGELAALKWADIDEDNQLLRITQSKTEAGVRAVAVGETTIALLERHRLAQRRRWMELGKGAAWSEDAPIFQSPEAMGLQHGNFWKEWVGIREEAGLPGLHFHDLRHVQASLMVRLKIHPRVAQDRLGHASSKTTMEIYSHSDAESQRHAAQAVEALFRQPG